MNQHDQILDRDGENQAVRCFLLHYQNPGVSIGALRNALRRSGFDGCWPDWVNGRETSESITKAGAQLWIRHLFSLEQTLSHVNETPKNEHDSADVLNKTANVNMMREALRWYGEQARLARLIHSEGDKGRQALDRDGGERARQALAAEPALNNLGYTQGIEAVAKMLDTKADDYAKEFGFDDMGGLEFSLEAQREYYSTLIEMAEEVRAMLGTKPAKLVRLTVEERNRIATSCQSAQQIIDAVMDAMERLNS